MEDTSSAILRFTIMIVASLILFYFVIWVVLGKSGFREQLKAIVMLSLTVVVLGMLIGKYGANLGLPWWIFYSVPMLMNVLLPPFVLRMGLVRTPVYLFLSLLSAPLIHVFFSWVFHWPEYLPFWKI